jgi:hypothetical protein
MLTASRLRAFFIFEEPPLLVAPDTKNCPHGIANS